MSFQISALVARQEVAEARTQSPCTAAPQLVPA